jgi:hypothetical protein
MGTHALYVRFPDGEIRHGSYASASDLARPDLFNSYEAAEAAGYRHGAEVSVVGNGDGVPVEVATVYGGGFHWPATATRGWLTSGYEPFETGHTDGIPDWLADYFRSAPRTPEEWCAEYGLVIADPDGWRGADAPPWGQPIGLVEFAERFARCTADMVAGDHGRLRDDAQAAMAA